MRACVRESVCVHACDLRGRLRRQSFLRCASIWIRKVRPESREHAVEFVAWQGVMLLFCTYTHTEVIWRLYASAISPLLSLSLSLSLTLTHTYIQTYTHTHTHKEREPLRRKNKQSDSAHLFCARNVSLTLILSLFACSLSLPPPLSLSLTHTHAHTHTQRLHYPDGTVRGYSGAWRKDP